MPDSEHTDEVDTISVKKRRLPGACDECKRKKVKCDSATKADGFCSNCKQYGLRCTHGEPVKKRGPKAGTSTSSYIQELELRVNSLEALLHELNPTGSDAPISHSRSSTTASEKSPSPSIQDLWSTNREITPPFASHSPQASGSSPSAMQDAPLEDDETDLADRLDKLSITKMNRFFGASSTFSLAHTAMNLRSQAGHIDTSAGRPKLHVKNWELQPWERATAEKDKPRYNFPPSDLIDHLVAVFFNTLHYSIPFVHEASFTADLRAGRHYKDIPFAGTVLLVLANAARYSNDPRVFSDGKSQLSAGWQWFEQVNGVKDAMFHGPTLYDLQTCALMVMYALGTSVPQTSWTMIGVGIRFAVEIGVHRRKAPGVKLTLEDEIKKRTFWALLSLDRTICLFLGRPSIIRDEDFDLELPIDCDEEYWVESPTGELTFHQPPNVPSRSAFFLQQLKLIEIMAYVSRTIYSIKKSKVMLGMTGKEWEQRTVSELDSALNNWMDQLPDHLRWDPHCENKTFFFQAATLIELFYLIQIQVHRPFIHIDSPLSFSSLAICTNAARSCCHVLELQSTKIGIQYPYCMFGSFICGIVLSMNIWSGKRSGLALNLKKEMSDVQKCLNILKEGSLRWNVAGRLWDMLDGISALGEINLSETGEVSLKRSREVVAELPYFMVATSEVASQPIPTAHYSADFGDPMMSSLAHIFNQDISTNSTNFNFVPLGNDTVDMWSAAPTGFSWEEWGSYIAHPEAPIVS